MLHDLIPPRWRKAIYSAIGVAMALEAIWDVVPHGTESRIFATLGALGFGLAAGNTRTKPEEG